MAYISCLPAELNSYVIVPNLSLSGLLFNLPPRITFRKVTAIQLEPYQRCTCRLDSRLSRMGHKSRNCTSHSTITIMSNSHGKKCQKCLCIASPVSDCISLYSRAGEWVKGLFIITGRMEIKDHEIQEHLEFYIKPDIACFNKQTSLLFFLKSPDICFQDDLWGWLSLIYQHLLHFLLSQCLWNLRRITHVVFYQLISSSSELERGICFHSPDSGTSIHKYNLYIHPYISTDLWKVSFFHMSPIAWEIL